MNMCYQDEIFYIQCPYRLIKMNGRELCPKTITGKHVMRNQDKVCFNRLHPKKGHQHIYLSQCILCGMYNDELLPDEERLP